jgi:hypothetical protein
MSSLQYHAIKHCIYQLSNNEKKDIIQQIITSINPEDNITDFESMCDSNM